MGDSPAPVDPWQRYGWLMAVVWLVFLTFPALALLGSGAALPAIIIGWIGLGIFACGYVLGFVIGFRRGWGTGPGVVRTIFFVSLVCAALTIPAIGWEAMSFLPFLMAYASYGLSHVWHWCVMLGSFGVVAVAFGVAFTQGIAPPWTILAIVLLMGAVNTINTWLIRRSMAADELRLELATSEERESVARDVHDLIGHSLTVVKLKAELASKLIDRDPVRARAELDDIIHLTSEAISGVRGTVTGLRTGGLADQLTASRDALQSAGIAVTLTGDPSMLSPAQSLTAAWIVREATTNVLRHAAARHVSLSIAPGTVAVRDDGIGVPGALGPIRANRNGIAGMTERAAAAGATLTVRPAAEGTGTEVSLTW